MAKGRNDLGLGLLYIIVLIAIIAVVLLIIGCILVGLGVGQARSPLWIAGAVILGIDAIPIALLVGVVCLMTCCNRHA
jgi:hypothetical protein